MKITPNFMDQNCTLAFFFSWISNIFNVYFCTPNTKIFGFVLASWAPIGKRAMNCCHLFLLEIVPNSYLDLCSLLGFLGVEENVFPLLGRKWTFIGMKGKFPIEELIWYKKTCPLMNRKLINRHCCNVGFCP